MTIAATTLKKEIHRYATETLGFDDCRFTSAAVGDLLNLYKHWIAQGWHGDMNYLERHLSFKENPELLLKGARSVIVLSKNYKNTAERKLKGSHKIARYAVGQDYHQVIGEKLKGLVQFIQTEHPEIGCYYGVDSRPIPERTYALKAGLGFLGKNTMVIKPGQGSYFFIGAILTTHAFQEDKPLTWNCGQCRLCLDACPTQALNENFTMNAAQCISYKTIEQKTPLTKDELGNFKGWIYGCDICQEVCPYNHDRTPLTNWAEFQPQAGVGFDFFEKNSELTPQDIPASSPMHRSRQRLILNIQMARRA